MNKLAAGIAALGRGEDKMLVHMTPREVEGLQKLALAKGGSLTTHPLTGLPEAGFLSDILPALAAAAAIYFTAGAAAPAVAGAAGAGAAGAGAAGIGAAGLEAATAAGLAGAAGTTAATGAGLTTAGGLGAGLSTAGGLGATGAGLSTAGGLGALEGAALVAPEIAGGAVGGLGTMEGAALVAPELAGGASGAGTVGAETALTQQATAPSMLDKGLAWAQENPMMAGLGGYSALSALTAPDYEFDTSTEQSNAKMSKEHTRPYDESAPSGYYFTDKGILKPNYAGGGLTALAGGGRFLEGPGDGVSDSIPAMIHGEQPQQAALADGEFVVPARIVSELGNGSSKAGAKRLYAMMERIQKARGKTTGKDRVAVDSKASKHLPA